MHKAVAHSKNQDFGRTSMNWHVAPDQNRDLDPSLRVASASQPQSSDRVAQSAAPDIDLGEVLRKMGKELIRMANAVDAGVDPSLGRPSLSDGIYPRDLFLARLAQAIYKSRRKRESFTQGALFGEAAWDILLDLFVNHVHRRPLRTTSVCMASAVPISTALRWITMLESHGLIERGNIEHDQRTMLVWLTKKGAQTVRNCLNEFWNQIEFILE